MASVLRQVLQPASAARIPAPLFHLLGAAERSRVGVQSAIDQIPTISILFVDASRLEALANDLRARLEAYS